uniref:DUF4218 domain-containing protein n=1 Tax=Tanacetum cinerariifolium TaxID=118510 RepID=A0A6L2NI07_TANCI|nr:hypothetical protein [Tanacetum cinerariifolium]
MSPEKLALTLVDCVKDIENSFAVLKLLKNSVEVLKILENKLKSLKLQENQPVDGLVPLSIKKFTSESVFARLLKNIIDVVDEDADIIDEEDPIRHDLADSDDEDLVNFDIDDGVNMSADVARGHDGDGDGDDRPPLYQIPLVRAPKNPIWVAGERAGCVPLQETRNLRLNAITDKNGPVSIRFEFGDRETLIPLGDHAAHWANYLGELVRELPPSLTCVPTWNLIAGHKSMRASSSICERSTMARRLLSRKGIGFLTGTGLTTWSASDVDVPCTFSRWRAQLLEEYPSLIHTFFMTHTIGGVFLNPEDKDLYDEMLRLQGLGSNTPSGLYDYRRTTSPAPQGHAKASRSLEFNGEKEDEDPPREFGQDQIQAQLARLAKRVKGKHPKFGGVKIERNVLVELNWTKRSFYELEYWSFLTLKHNLDVIHIEKNVLQSILKTLLTNDKSKDTAKARQDLKRLGIRSGLWLGQNKNEKCSKPQASYSFTPEERNFFCQFIKGVKLPDGFESTLKHKVTDNDTNITGLKSHDSKQKGSIAEGYITKEALTFSSHYFWDVTTKFNRPDRNVDCPHLTCQFQVFKSLCKSISLRSVIRIDHRELKKVIWYVLHNNLEIDTYWAKFKSEFSNKDMKEEFPGWFGKQMESSTTREYTSLIHTFFLTHIVGGVFLNPEDNAIYGLGSDTPSGVPYTNDGSWSLFAGESSGSTFSMSLESQPEYGGGGGSGGCGDDEPGDDEDGDEDEDDS